MPKRKDEPDNPLALIFERISTLTKSSLLSDRLIGINTLLFIIIACLVVTRLWLLTESFFSFGGLFILLLSLLIAILVSALYLLFIKFLVQAASDKVTPQRYGVIILLCGFSLAGAGLFLNVAVLSYVAISLVVCQIFILFVGMFIGFSNVNITDIRVKANDFKNIFGNFGTIISIVSLVLQVVFFVVGIFIK